MVDGHSVEALYERIEMNGRIDSRLTLVPRGRPKTSSSIIGDITSHITVASVIHTVVNAMYYI
jgi:hypothetical protein